MTDEPMSSRALIAAYKACARPSAAREAELWASLAAADRAARARTRRAAPSLAPWLALAAVLVIVAAWALDLPRRVTSGHVLRDMSHQAAHDALPTSPEPARARDGADSATPGATAPDEGDAPTGAVEAPQRVTGRGAARQAADDARPRQAPAASPGSIEGAETPSPSPADGVEDGGDRVLAEMALLQRAQAVLRGGRPGEALELLAQHAERFAHGSMAEERQALRVLALCASGETASGSAEQAGFLRAHPRSTYAPRVIAACAQEQDPEDMSKNH